MLKPIAILALGYVASLSLPLAAQDKSMPQQIADVMAQLNGGVHPGFRFAHAKGMVLTGTFTPTKGASSISRVAHLKGRWSP